MEAKHIRQLFKQYLLGQAPESQQDLVDNWYHSFDNTPVELTNREKQATAQEIWDRIAAEVLTEKKVRRIPAFLKVAAAAAVVLTAGLTWYLLQPGSPADNPAFTVLSTRNGERSVITIKDGTRLTLNAGTTVRVYNDFTRERKLQLVDGEVFFDVQQDPARPFLIESDSLRIQVLGTTFNIAAYQQLHNISVGVVSGSISVRNQRQLQQVLKANQGLVYDKAGQYFRATMVDSSQFAWRQGRLVLNDLSFQEMALLMEKNFGVTVITTDETIQNTKYTSELLSSMTAEQAVEVLAAIHHLKIDKKNNQFILTK
ncbi:MAG: FecR domain-containing protein [Candidatus Pseudobacter hemicellulosilyticus]|uniref:FecR domain-containing protein n=1 Tax=Candidatus Pseudobacter hemicellulosilyticus TaxID=3121375 RepID=A0AAJ5WPW0_9BACT|nr:MAG: FecR domain-containing protein [Pseudobacter sp.]